MKGIDVKMSSIFRTLIIVIIIAAIFTGCSKEQSPGYTIEPSAISSTKPSVSAVESEPTLTQSPTIMPDDPAALLDAAIAQAPILDNGITIENISRFLGKSEAELLEQYEGHIKYTREDGPYDEYYYNDLRITLVCYSKGYNLDGIVKYIELDRGRIAWAGIDASMNFKQVTGILGEAEIYTLEDGLPGLKTYELRYQYENIKLRIYSWDMAGDGGIYISVVDGFIPEYRPIRITPEQIGHYFDLSFEDLKQEIGEDDKYTNSIIKEYSKYGAKFEYDEQQNKLLRIVLNSRYQINGLKNGISLEDVIRIVGKKKVETYWTEEDGPINFIQYEFKNFILQVLDYEDDWPDNWAILGNEYLGQFD